MYLNERHAGEPQTNKLIPLNICQPNALCILIRIHADTLCILLALHTFIMFVYMGSVCGDAYIWSANMNQKKNVEYNQTNINARHVFFFKLICCEARKKSNRSERERDRKRERDNERRGQWNKTKKKFTCIMKSDSQSHERSAVIKTSYFVGIFIIFFFVNFVSALGIVFQPFFFFLLLLCSGAEFFFVSVSIINVNFVVLL